MDIFSNGAWLPLVFAFLMGLSMLIYTVLDGYDLGIGILMWRGSDAEQDRMLGSIGPFWDANETWLVLGVGLLLVAFPKANGIVLSNLYLPVVIMLMGLILRGVAFDFRAKAKTGHKNLWNNAFVGGSLTATLAQGYMLGSYIVGFAQTTATIIFSILVALSFVAGYCLVGASWLILKTEGELQIKAIKWAKRALIGVGLGIILVSIVTPLASTRIFDKWFSWDHIFFLAPIPLITFVLLFNLYKLLNKLPKPEDRHCSRPFLMTIITFVLCFYGLAYSFYPYIVPDQLLITDAASAPGSLMIILVGALIVLPILFAYTFFAYRVFRGKTQDLRYD